MSKVSNHCVEVTVQIVVYKLLFTNFCLQLCLRKDANHLNKAFTQFSHIENKSTFLKRNCILKTKAHFEGGEALKIFSLDNHEKVSS